MNGLSDELLIDPAVLRIAGPVIGVVFLATLVITVVKIIRGPSILDRMIATDVFLATLLCGFGAFIAATGRVDLLPVLLAVAAMGFVGSVSVSRYVSRSESSAPVIGETSDMARAHTVTMAEQAEEERAAQTRQQAPTVGPLFAQEQEQEK